VLSVDHTSYCRPAATSLPASTRCACGHRPVRPYLALPLSEGEASPLPRLLITPARLTIHLCHAAAPRAPTPATAGRAMPRRSPRAPPNLGLLPGPSTATRSRPQVTRHRLVGILHPLSGPADTATSSAQVPRTSTSTSTPASTPSPACHR
jgi:hypothetical protein